MSTDKIDANKNPTEVPTKDSKTELSDEALDKVSGGAPGEFLKIGNTAGESQDKSYAGQIE